MCKKFCKIFGFRNSLVGSLIFIILTLNLLRFAPSCNSLSSAHFLIPTSKGAYVQGNFTSIQKAINEAENGSSVHVPSGVYYERVVINKTISLIGQNASTTIIDGSNTGTVVRITADNVSISGFAIQNSGWGWYRSGIETQQANDCKIENNILFHTCHNIRLNGSRNCLIAGNKIDHINQMGYGIRLTESINCTVSNNFVAKNIGGIVFENSSNCTAVGNYVTRNSDGIRLYSSSSNNKIITNTVFNNSYCGMIYPVPGEPSPYGNILFHNSFVNNTNPFIIQSSGNVWDDGYPSGGNYWSQYGGTDLHSGPLQNEAGSDGIGDIQYAVGGYDKDGYPLIHPYGSVCNLETSLIYLTMQSAINAPETLDGHAIFVKSGTYYEHVVVDKKLSLIGENQTTTIIDGNNVGTILTVNANNVSIIGFTIRNSGLNFPPYGMDCGILLDHSIGSSISHGLITNNRIGIYLFFSRDSVIEHNVVFSNYENGIWLWYSGNSFLAENKISNSSYNFGVFGGSFSDFNNMIDTSNTVDGKPIQYLIGAKDEIFDNQTNIGVLYLINSNNVTVRDLSLTKNGHGVFCYNVTDSRIENVTASNNNYGMYLQNSFDNFVSNNYCPSNWVGICLQESRNNTVESNVAPDNEKGISLYDADYNIVARNTISNNLYGIRLFASSFNEVFHNNLIENTKQADLISSYQNIWDNGFEGNYWSDYTGADEDKDGIGNLPYEVTPSPTTPELKQYDRWPLMGIFHNLGTIVGSYVDAISNSTIDDFQYFEFNGTIRMHVSNMTVGQTYGFCRICISHVLVEPEISVIIDNGLTEVLYPNYDLRDDGLRRWIYFAYRHSSHEVFIVPEFWSIIFLLALMVATLLCLLFKRLKNWNEMLER
jgi:parallel beta-helix repeat protein